MITFSIDTLGSSNLSGAMALHVLRGLRCSLMTIPAVIAEARSGSWSQSSPVLNTRRDNSTSRIDIILPDSSKHVREANHHRKNCFYTSIFSTRIFVLVVMVGHFHLTRICPRWWSVIQPAICPRDPPFTEGTGVRYNTASTQHLRLFFSLRWFLKVGWVESSGIYGLCQNKILSLRGARLVIIHSLFFAENQLNFWSATIARARQDLSQFFRLHRDRVGKDEFQRKRQTKRTTKLTSWRTYQNQSRRTTTSWRQLITTLWWQQALISPPLSRVSTQETERECASPQNTN